jgi:hypothetical protein
MRWMCLFVVFEVFGFLICILLGVGLRLLAQFRGAAVQAEELLRVARKSLSVL